MNDFGYEVVEHVFDAKEIAALSQQVSVAPMARSRAGARHLMAVPEIAALARDPRLMGLAARALGRNPIPFGATLFDKSPRSNWLVVWHQDTALPLRARREMEGWGPWSVKNGIAYAHAPAAALSRVVALRVHLDASVHENGPLRVLPGSHRLGVLSDEQIHELAAQVRPVECIIPAGGVLMMRPLIVHASSKGIATLPRRVIHLEYADSTEIDDGLELRAA